MSAHQDPAEVISPQRTFAQRDAHEQIRRLLLVRLRSRREEIDLAILTRVRDGVLDPARDDVDLDYLQGLHAAAVAAVDYVLVGIECAGRPPQAIPLPVLTQARRAARTGVGLDTALRRYVAGYALLEDFIMREAEHDEVFAQGKVLREVLATAASLVDALITAVADAYRDELESGAGTALTEAPGTPRLLTGAASPESRSSPSPIIGSQRVRILQAIVQIVAERGCGGASVALVSTRAKVSRSTFYEQLSSVDEGLVAVMESTLEQVAALVADAFAGQECWHDGMRFALAAVLSFFDSKPDLARVCLVESLGGGPNLLEHRARVIAAFRVLVVVHVQSEVSHPSPMVAEGVLASVMGIVHARLTARETQPLILLLGPLMGTIVAPVSDEQSVQHEIRRGDQLAREIQAGAVPLPLSVSEAEEKDHAQTLLAIPDGPLSRRAWECLLFLFDHRYASNREVAEGIGVAHQSHISRLLSCLLEERLVTKSSEGPGKRNAWTLTSTGEEMVNDEFPTDRTQ